MELIKALNEKNWSAVGDYCKERMGVILKNIIDTRKNDHLERLKAASPENG